jgi:hypothetical protein
LFFNEKLPYIKSVSKGVYYAERYNEIMNESYKNSITKMKESCKKNMGKVTTHLILSKQNLIMAIDLVGGSLFYHPMRSFK